MTKAVEREAEEKQEEQAVKDTSQVKSLSGCR
jgi:hypothetical protein